MAKPEEFRNQSIEELLAVKVDLEKELFALRNERRINMKMEAPHRIGLTKKDIARVNTIIREKQMAQS